MTNLENALNALPPKTLREHCVAAQHAVGHLASLTVSCTTLLRLLDAADELEKLKAAELRKEAGR